MKDPYSGDPKMFLTPNGMTMLFNNGTVEKDQGFENFVTISLFTAPNYWGNTLKKGKYKYGSEFYNRTKIKKEPITLANIRAWEKSAEKDLKYSPFGKISVTITNPESNKIKLIAKISPPTGESSELIFLNNGQNWIGQALYGGQDEPFEKVKPQRLLKNVYTSGDDSIYTSDDGSIYISDDYLSGVV